MSLVLVEFLACVYDGRFRCGLVAEELDYFKEIFHAVNHKIIYDSCFPGVLFRYDKSFEMFGSGSDSDRKCAFYGLQGAVKAQFSYHHVFFQVLFWNISVCAHDANCQR